MHTLSTVYRTLSVYLYYFSGYHGTRQTAWHGARIKLTIDYCIILLILLRYV
jgi:hypothetical protein